MKTIQTSRTIDIPESVTVEANSRVVKVTGPRGTLERSFKYAKMDLKVLEGGRQLRALLWFGKRKSNAGVRTITSHIENMITGVTKGFQYKMRLVYAHFPINVSFEGDGKQVLIRNFLGEKVIRTVDLDSGVSIERSQDVKDQLVLSGNDVEAVGRCSALIHQSCLVKRKDIRKFLDGIYLSEKGNVVTE